PERRQDAPLASALGWARHQFPPSMLAQNALPSITSGTWSPDGGSVAVKPLPSLIPPSVPARLYASYLGIGSSSRIRTMSSPYSPCQYGPTGSANGRIAASYFPSVPVVCQIHMMPVWVPPSNIARGPGFATRAGCGSWPQDGQAV